MTVEPPNSDTEELEGIGGDEDSQWGDYPIDTMLIRNENRTIHDILRRISQGSFVMDPDFQRDFIWDDDKQSKLVESVLMRIPLPVFYLAEDSNGRMIVVDGLQRLSTFQRYVDNDLALRLPEQSELHQKKFKDLSPKLQNRIEDCNLVLYIIDSKVPEQARLDIFERVNGGVPLTRQQMRNCLYTGQATRFLKEEARKKLFIDATGGSLNQKTMRDREFVNRFCAFSLLPLSFYRRNDMDAFLAEALEEMNGMSRGELDRLSLSLQESMQNNWATFGRHAFRKHESEDSRRSVLNASLWDVLSTGMARYPVERVASRSTQLKHAFYSLMGDREFIYSITYGTNDINQISHRFEIMNSTLEMVLGDA